MLQSLNCVGVISVDTALETIMIILQCSIEIKNYKKLTNPRLT
jgi:hypothetical protein